MLLGGLGNFLTLLAIPYVRLKYGKQFSVLQLNSIVLILHLSFADLLYSQIGFPNFLMVLDFKQYTKRIHVYFRSTSIEME